MSHYNSHKVTINGKEYPSIRKAQRELDLTASQYYAKVEKGELVVEKHVVTDDFYNTAVENQKRKILSSMKHLIDLSEGTDKKESNLIIMDELMKILDKL